MKAVLGLDTATSELSVAVARGGSVLAEREAAPEAGRRPLHATHLLPAVEEAVEQAGGWEEIGRIGVGIGPGTFTGLRIGIATARALAQARAIEIVGVPSLATLAAGAAGPASAAGRQCLAALDAKRSEVFAALFDPDGTELWPAWVGAPEALAARVAELPVAPLAIGDGSVRFREQLESSGAVIPPDGDSVHRLRARHTCAIAAELLPQSAEDIVPAYLRRPDAESWRENQRRKPGD